MVGVYLICIVLFPISVVYPIRMKKKTILEILTKEDSVVIKGIAVCFVILAHLISALETQYQVIPILKVFTVLGGMGVLLFFFLSGFGLFKGYANRKPSIDFVKKRIKNVVYPYILMKICFYIMTLFFVKDTVFNIKSFILNFADWFVVVIVIEYIIFYISWVVASRTTKKGLLLLLDFILSLIVALIFVRIGLVARWYNGLLLFPFGMLLAKYEKALLFHLKKQWIVKLFINIIIFIALGSIFTLFKGNIWADIIKTIAGIELAVITCGIFIRYELKSRIMKYIGKNSLYFYIIHLCIMTFLDQVFKLDRICYLYITVFLTFPITAIFVNIVKNTTIKSNNI